MAGFRIASLSNGESLGRDVSYAGDINGDGLADVIVGANLTNANGTNSGRIYVVYGKTDNTTVYASDLVTGKGGFVINGASASDNLGNSVSNAAISMATATTT